VGSYEVIDPGFEWLVDVGAPLEILHTGMKWAEGPAYSRETGTLIFSDVPSDRMFAWSDVAGVEVFREPSAFANGNTFDGEGRLVTCEQGKRRISRLEKDGTVASLVSQYRGSRLNSPNDVVERSDGTLWFTDPTYGISSDEQGYLAESELAGCFVFRFDPRSGEVDVVAEDMVMPNGLAFSVDETVLYLTDSGATEDPGGPHHIRAYDVVDGKRLSNSRVLVDIDPGWPDGLRVDSEDRIWCSAGDGVRCFTSDGTALGLLCVPETVSNLAFGGPDLSRMFITATSSLYSVEVECMGAR
jgi:gluconolactonase